MELPGSTKRKIIKDENCQNVPYLETTEVLLLSIIIIKKTQESCMNLFQISHSVNYEIFHPKILHF